MQKYIPLPGYERRSRTCRDSDHNAHFREIEFDTVRSFWLFMVNVMLDLSGHVIHVSNVKNFHTEELWSRILKAEMTGKRVRIRWWSIEKRHYVDDEQKISVYKKTDLLKYQFNVLMKSTVTSDEKETHERTRRWSIFERLEWEQSSLNIMLNICGNECAMKMWKDSDVKTSRPKKNHRQNKEEWMTGQVWKSWKEFF